jgi:prolyl 4-hydroxylase
MTFALMERQHPIQTEYSQGHGCSNDPSSTMTHRRRQKRRQRQCFQSAIRNNDHSSCRSIAFLITTLMLFYWSNKDNDHVTFAPVEAAGSGSETASSPTASSRTLSTTTSYGVDISMPMHHHDVSTNYVYLPHNVLPSLYPTPQLYREMPLQTLGNRKQVYQQFLEDCRTHYRKKNKPYNVAADTTTNNNGDGNSNTTSLCDEYEDHRIATNLRQPKSMVNYTETGFHRLAKAVTDPNVSNFIKEFWKKYQEQWIPEQWPDGNTYT